MIGKPSRLGVRTPSLLERVEDAPRLGEEVCAERVAAAFVHIQAGERRRERGDRGGAGVEIGRRRRLQSRFISVGHAMNAASDEYAFDRPATTMTLS